MKVFNSTLAAIGLAAFVFASCSDSTSDQGKESPAIIPADLTSVTLTSQDVDNSRVVNYKNSTANARKFFLTRAGEANFITGMPEDMPVEPGNALTVNGTRDLIGEGKAFAISGKKTIDFSGKTIKNATIFIHGGSTMKYNATAGGNTFVLEGNAKLEYTGSGVMVAENDIVYVKKAIGTLAATGDMIINGTLYANLRSTSSETGKDLISGLGAIKEQTKEEKENSITPKQNITFGQGAKAYINGSIRAINLKVENGAYVYAKENLFNNDDNGNAIINGNLWIGGFIKTRTLDVNGYLKAEEALKVTNAFNVHDGANVEATYINVTNNTKDGDNNVIKGAATLSLNGTGKITIHDKNVITANNLITDNKSKGQITLEGNDAVAVIKAHKFTNNGASRIEALATPGTNSTFLLQFQENYSGPNQYNTFEDLDIAANYADYDKVADPKTPNVTLINQKNKLYGYQWSGDPATIASQAKLDLIASEESPDGQSATCIQSANNKLYVSYHTYGDKKFGGNIEVLSMTGNQLNVDAKKAAENCDYNHLIVDGNSLYLAGSGTKSAGAFLGKVDINGGNLGEEVKLYAIDNKSKMDANCVAEFNGEHVVATTQGLTSFDKDFNFWSKKGAEGKHVVTANSKLYTLDVDGNVNVYNNNELDTPVKTYKVGTVVPKDNKAVMAVEETSGDIYVCKGENGVAKISGDQVNENFFTCPKFTKPEKADLAGTVKGRANGIAIGSEYVYVACGGYGLVVLDKTTGTPVCHRKANAYKNNDCGSANYVAIENVNGEEYVYVAYGQNRVQVFKVTKTKQ